MESNNRKRVLHKRINKDQFIGDYIDKRMKKHNFPRITLQYYSTLAKYEEAAEKAWKLKLNSQSK